MNTEKLTKRFIKRFHSNYKVDKTTGCWNWTGSLNLDGYGHAWFRKSVRAHRFSWELYNGKIPKTKVVCHRCDNRKCVNPNHLFLGTIAENNQEMHDKGRWCDRKGEKHPMAKLTKKDILEIRKMKLVYRKIAKIYKICRGYVSLIKSKKVWKHI